LNSSDNAELRPALLFAIDFIIIGVLLGELMDTCFMFGMFEYLLATKCAEIKADWSRKEAKVNNTVLTELVEFNLKSSQSTTARVLFLVVDLRIRAPLR
jgi:hypothetical protein